MLIHSYVVHSKFHSCYQGIYKYLVQCSSLHWSMEDHIQLDVKCEIMTESWEVLIQSYVVHSKFHSSCQGIYKYLIQCSSLHWSMEDHIQLDVKCEIMTESWKVLIQSYVVHSKFHSSCQGIDKYLVQCSSLHWNMEDHIQLDVKCEIMTES